MNNIDMKKEVIFWGCGDGGKYAYEHLKDKWNIVAFGDKDIKKIGTLFEGKKVISTKEIITEYKTAIILNTVMSVTHDIVVDELRETGIKNAVYKYTDFLEIDSVEDRRNKCAEFHINNMENYFEIAEESKNLDIFWGINSPFKRLFEQLDTTHIVELACGRGRHVPKYMDNANTIMLVDILEKNIDFCKERFQGIDKINYYVNSGCDLSAIGDDSVTSIFSYDAMVHFESIDVYHYLQETNRVLKSGGMALYHHSNNDKDYKATFLSGECGRNYMSMGLFAHFADRAGLKVIEQVKYQWNKNIVDGITLLQKE